MGLLYIMLVDRLWREISAVDELVSISEIPSIVEYNNILIIGNIKIFIIFRFAQARNGPELIRVSLFCSVITCLK